MIAGEECCFVCTVIGILSCLCDNECRHGFLHEAFKLWARGSIITKAIYTKTQKNPKKSAMRFDATHDLTT